MHVLQSEAAQKESGLHSFGMGFSVRGSGQIVCWLDEGISKKNS